MINPKKMNLFLRLNLKSQALCLISAFACTNSRTPLLNQRVFILSSALLRLFVNTDKKSERKGSCVVIQAPSKAGKHLRCWSKSTFEKRGHCNWIVVYVKACRA